MEFLTARKMIILWDFSKQIPAVECFDNTITQTCEEKRKMSGLLLGKSKLTSFGCEDFINFAKKNR
jgi:hypothetical protein